MSLVKVKDLGKSYRSYRSEWQRFAGWFGVKSKPLTESWVLKGVSFEVKAGETIGILGKNGAGKSTLLKMITGTLQPSTGSVQINGRIAAILELGMGFNPELTGRQNAIHASGLMGFNNQQITDALAQIQGFAGVGDYFDKPVRTYSSGMQSRVAFAVATAYRPDVLIVDEALSVGDAYFQAKCYERIAQFKAQGTALILVTHSTEDVTKHCDRALFIREGRLEADGKPAAITNLYLDDLFGKRGSKNAARGGSASASKLMGDSAEDVFHSRPGYRAEEHRWGAGGAAIIDYAIVVDNQLFPSQLTSAQPVEFYFKVVFKQDVESLVAGFLIRTLEGLYLYGTNSYLASNGKAALSGTAGEIKTYRFSIPMNLNEGDYMLSFGVSAGDPEGELVPLERRYDSVIVRVARPKPFWGVVDLQASFGFEEQGFAG